MESGNTSNFRIINQVKLDRFDMCSYTRWADKVKFMSLQIISFKSGLVDNQIQGKILKKLSNVTSAKRRDTTQVNAKKEICSTCC